MPVQRVENENIEAEEFENELPERVENELVQRVVNSVLEDEANSSLPRRDGGEFGGFGDRIQGLDASYPIDPLG